MAARKEIECPTWRPRSKLTSEIQLHLCGSLFTLDKVLLALKSSKIANLLQKNPQADLSLLLGDIPADQESMELVCRFCHGFDITLSTQNIIHVACIAQYLGMTDTHCPNNLLSKAVSFFEQHIITSWNNSINALKSAENVRVHEHALHLGLIDYCVESIISKVVENPHLLGEPRIKNNLLLTSDDDDSDDHGNENGYRPNARRKLFGMDWKSEDLTSLPLRLYAPLVHAMSQRKVPQEYLAANLCQYSKTWLFDGGDEMPAYEMNSRREIVETLASLLPQYQTINMVPCAFLSEMLKFAIALDAGAECKNGLEVRIGMQLDQATSNDLLIPSRGYAKDEKYDTECVRRILKNFYGNYAGPDPTPLNVVSELMDEFLTDISSDIDLKTSTFLEIAEMSVAASDGIDGRTSDGIYRAINVYLDKHKHLTESEREKLCRVLDCVKLSYDASMHAAQNERLPVRVVVQVLFVAQLKLREAIPKELVMREEEEEIEKMRSKVLEVEKECHVMKREIERGGGCSSSSSSSSGVKKRKKMSMWREMKRKLGCVTTSSTMHECNCHVKRKKVHPR